jgi:alpha-1,6-mannosyltransferase
MTVLAPPRASSPEGGDGARTTPGRGRPSRARVLISVAGLVAAVMAAALLAVGAAAGPSFLVDNGRPVRPAVFGLLAGLGSPLQRPDLAALMLLMAVGYAALVWANGLSRRVVVGAVVGLHVIVLLAPPILSADVFSYLAYARLGAVHGINPYVNGPAAFPSDPIYANVAPVWRHMPSAYGPLYTLISYTAAWLPLAAGVWWLKILSVGASLATVALGTLGAKRRGHDPLRAGLVLGANPVLLLFAAGSAANDTLMLALMTGGVLLALDHRDALGGAVTTAGAAIKATAGFVLPFMLVGRRRPWQTLGGVAAAIVLIAIPALAAFEGRAAGFVPVILLQQGLVSKNSFVTAVAGLFDVTHISAAARLALRGVMAGGLIYLLVRVWRGADWVAGAGWAFILTALTTTWLLGWYLVWPLPLAVIARDRRLLVATLAMQGIYLLPRMAALVVTT